MTSGDWLKIACAVAIVIFVAGAIAVEIIQALR